MSTGQPVRVGSYYFGDRELFLLDLESSDDMPEIIFPPSRHFACLLAWDATRTSDDSILTLARRLLGAGCVYVCCWGPDCERVHDLVDRVDFELNPDAASIVMTTWHAERPLGETLWFLLNVVWPDPAFEDTCGASIGIAIGSAQWATEIRTALSDPSAFSAKTLAAGEDPA